MITRPFLCVMAAVSLLLWIGAQTRAQAAADAPRFAAPGQMRPTFLLLLSDDQTYRALGRFGELPVKTSNLDRLAKRGLLFTHCFTLVIFLTDNGGIVGVSTFHGGRRDGKGTPFEGATRVPSFWRWPAGFRGGADCAALTAHKDISRR